MDMDLSGSSDLLIQMEIVPKHLEQRPYTCSTVASTNDIKS